MNDQQNQTEAACGGSALTVELGTDLADVVSKAMRRAFQLGQTYWQQADSDYTSQHRKADETHARFQALVEETRAEVHAQMVPNA